MFRDVPCFGFYRRPRAFGSVSCQCYDWSLKKAEEVGASDDTSFFLSFYLSFFLSLFLSLPLSPYLPLSSRLPPGHFSPLFLFSSQGLDTEDVGQRLGAGLETSLLSCALPLMIHNITGALVSMHPFSCHTRVFPFSFTLYLFLFCFLFPLIARRQFLSNLRH